MLEVRYQVLNFFQLVLEIFSKLVLNIVNQSFRISKIFLKKSFELKLHDEDNALLAMFILSLLQVNNTIKKWDCKQNTVYPNGY